MRITTPFYSALFAIVLSGCAGNDAPPAEQTPVVENTYQAAEDALENGKNAATVSKLLMDNFEAVSDSNTGKLNMQASQDFSRIARELADKFPEDTMAAMPFYRSAEVVRAMNDPKRAAAIYRDVYERYPAFSKSPEALFMLAFTYDEDLKDLDAARSAYNDFLESYPTHSFADDTEMLLKNLGKSDEEILKELEAKTGE
ncbi:tetratricopeptide repeat protein [Neolewinella aurantiaca]|uniref:Tetratricopeptide repeat protein n=1 Tax=Neolewinella aurantiaca TaxID=2602767 RepID=A0A5C7FCY7_9BACT|nr:tetratricopeptide repeat protein [Neolewinella aurantiaca]TXF88561.1 tetratricopeptide repeat protein [Neolewinella aurantiaca]